MPMTRTATPIATATDRPGSGIPPLFHAAAAAWIAGMLAFAATAPREYEAFLQEDRWVEWWTVGLFAAAAVARFRTALPRRRFFDVLVALFCVFVAGEEFSWGQRLLGFTPPDPFLAHNTQQELTVHNFADVFGKPKGVLIVALAGYGLLLPVLALRGPGRRLLATVRATPPQIVLAPWFAAAVVLLLWYPADYTGEWVEALAGGLFLTAAVPARRPLAGLAAIAALAAVGLTGLSGLARSGAAEDAECARAETAALLGAIEGGAARASLARRDRVHKRVWIAIRDGYLDPAVLDALAAVSCAGATESASGRRRHAIDPWGMAYWLRKERDARGMPVLTVYSMGPNRRRDSGTGPIRQDDVIAGAGPAVED